ncbi:MAG: efflux RND transporter periplasmic adaptor subunit [Caldilineaceae bacterium]|nr:efflux RND transporter periplasmic adaptor subunit [Caldilineaceae bacterium]
MRRLLLTLIIAVLLVVGGWFGYQRFVVEAQTQSDATSFETVQVARGSIASTVSATGSIEPEDEVSLLFRSVGPVDRVLVAVGDTVQQGQVLAELDTTDLTLALANAKVAEEIAAAQLAKLETPPDPMDVAAAQAAVEVAQASVASAEAALRSAQAAYQDLLAGPSETERTINEAQLRQAEVNLKQAQQAYNKIKDQPDSGLMPQAAQLEQATVNYEVAKAQVARTEEPATQAQLAQAFNQIAQAQSALRNAQAQVVNAQNNLDKLLDGPSSEDLQIARAQVKQAQLNQLQAENTLANARIVAPINGVVSQVNIKAGEVASNARPAVVLSDLERFEMRVLVDEIDVRQVAVGQNVRLSVDALPDAEITGQVVELSPTASNVNGVVAYEVTIVPNPTDAPLRAGMSATAIITTANVDDVILVPNRFITLDRNTGEAYVYKLVSGQPVKQAVELGLRNERSSQVLAGLDAGDTLAFVTASSEEQLRGALFGGN